MCVDSSYNKYFCASLGHYYAKKFLISSSIDIKTFFFKTYIFILAKNSLNSYYCLCPFFVSFTYINNYLYIFTKSNLIIPKDLKIFFTQFSTCLKQLNQINSKTFLMRGVGLKASILNSLSLNLKLGHSHLISIIIPYQITISIFKKKLILSSYNKISLGNFCSLIYKFKPINIFTGKGLLKKKHFFKLKEYIKKI